MKTINLDKNAHSVDELLAIARREVVLLVSQDGTSFVLEEADDFELEVTQLGNSENFMKFLKGRSREKASLQLSSSLANSIQQIHSP